MPNIAERINKEMNTANIPVFISLNCFLALNSARCFTSALPNPKSLKKSRKLTNENTAKKRP